MTDNTIIVRQKGNSPLFTEQPMTLKSGTTISSGTGASKMVQLTDVASVGMTDGSTIIYHASNTTFVVEHLPFQNLSNCDCGSF